MNNARVLTETVNLRTGSIRARGHLTLQGADLLRGAADHLRGRGHSTVLLDLRGVRGVDDEGLTVLRSLRDDFAAGGSELLIRHGEHVPA